MSNKKNKYQPRMYNISKLLRYKTKRCDILEVCYSNGEQICYASVLIPEMSTKLDRQEAINFIKTLWDNDLSIIISGQIFHFEGFYHKSKKTRKIEFSKESKKSYGLRFHKYDTKFLPIKLMY